MKVATPFVRILVVFAFSFQTEPTHTAARHLLGWGLRA